MAKVNRDNFSIILISILVITAIVNFWIAEYNIKVGSERRRYRDSASFYVCKEEFANSESEFKTCLLMTNKYLDSANLMYKKLIIIGKGHDTIPFIPNNKINCN
jgi:hypothetical protein